MTVEFESGYSLPVGDLPLKNARIIHAGNRAQVKTWTTSTEVANYPLESVDVGDTVDRWKPTANGLLSTDDLSAADWTLIDLTVGADGLTLSETATTAAHRILQNFTFTASSYTYAVIVERQTIPIVRLRGFDGTDNFNAYFDLRDGTVGTVSGTGATAFIRELSKNRFYCSISFTASAGSGTVYLYAIADGEVVTYLGNVNNTIKVEQFMVNGGAFTGSIDLFQAEEIDTFCIAGHNLGSRAGKLRIQYYDTIGAAWVTAVIADLTDDSPVMYIFEPVTAEQWRFRIDNVALPEVSVVRLGLSLQMEQPFYSGYTPARMNRSIEIIGNISGSGELLGRTKRRTILNGSYSWSHLTYDWVRANLDGPSGLIQSAELEPLFIAWRPGETQDVDYIMRANVSPPVAMGVKSYQTFSLSGEVHSYE